MGERDRHRLGTRYLIKNGREPADEEQTKCLLSRLAERVKSGNHQLTNLSRTQDLFDK
jgi:hypothetical protein